MRYILGVIGRLRPSRLREYARARRESRDLQFYDELRRTYSDLSFEEATRDFDQWWSRNHPRRARAVNFLRYLFQVWPGRPRPS
jgi:hypothetical protein